MNVKSLSPHAQTWAQQRRVCRPAQPLRLGDGFRYHTAASHDNAALFRRRMLNRLREAFNGS
jgi:hypothetical protein